eukprot:1161816-Pelagomonas_calceolata.AAC.1
MGMDSYGGRPKKNALVVPCPHGWANTVLLFLASTTHHARFCTSKAGIASLAEEARKVQLAAHGQAAAVVVDDKAVAAAGGPASYAPTMCVAVVQAKVLRAEVLQAGVLRVMLGQRQAHPGAFWGSAFHTAHVGFFETFRRQRPNRLEKKGSAGPAMAAQPVPLKPAAMDGDDTHWNPVHVLSHLLCRSAAPAMAAQPVPLKPAAMDGNGTLLPPPGTRPPPLTDQHPAALAAAWSPEVHSPRLAASRCSWRPVVSDKMPNSHVMVAAKELAETNPRRKLVPLQNTMDTLIINIDNQVPGLFRIDLKQRTRYAMKKERQPLLLAGKPACYSQCKNEQLHLDKILMQFSNKKGVSISCVKMFLTHKAGFPDYWNVKLLLFMRSWWLTFQPHCLGDRQDLEVGEKAALSRPGAIRV